MEESEWRKKKKPFSNTHNCFYVVWNQMLKWKKDSDWIITKGTLKLKTFLCGKWFHLLIWNSNCVSTCTALWSGCRRRLKKKKKKDCSSEIPRGDLTFSRTHTVLVKSAFDTDFLYGGIKVTMITVLGWVLGAGVVAAAGDELCHLQPHHWLVDAVVVTVKLRLQHLYYSN